MMELLTEPCREKDLQRVDDCFALFSRFPNLEWIAPTLALSDAAAQIRAQWNLRAPGAIEATTVIQSGISAFLGKDAAFRRVPKLNTLLLDDLL